MHLLKIFYDFIAIAADAFVRVVDIFVDVIDLKSIGFAHKAMQCIQTEPGT